MFLGHSYISGISMLDQSGPGGNDNKRVFHTPQRFWTEASQPDTV